jgi:hypothetical protein
MSESLIYSVRDVFTKYLDSRGVEKYNIPEYQRGYKWSRSNVKALLDDLWKFHKAIMESSNKDQFYCLQNITLVEKKGNKMYNVVDGQQRLTTLVILLSYLDKASLVKDKLKYSVRDETHNFIQNEIITKKIWSTDISPDKAKRKDQYYISAVADEITIWFKEKEEEKNVFCETILEHTKFIVNLLEDDEERIFSNLNGGKVELDGADLLRAILMTRSAKEKFGISGNSSLDPEDNRVNEYRVRLGMELDEMNRWWGQPEVSTYFTQLLPIFVLKVAKPKFDLKKNPINILYMLYYEAKRKDIDKFDSSLFSFFEYGKDSNGNLGDDNWEMYAEIRKLHNVMQDWFDDQIVYHYLGYLFFRFKDQKAKECAIIFHDIYNKLWHNEKSKLEFRKKLKSLIIFRLLSPYQNKDNPEQLSQNKLLDVFKDAVTDIKKNWFDDNENIYHVLILKDIIYAVGKKAEKLPVVCFKPNAEDREHIRPQTPNKDSSEDTDKYYDGLNSIGNIVLLVKSVNCSYGNAGYADKRQRILKEYNDSKTYIRPHTLNVFIKAGVDNENKRDLNEWTSADIEDNAKEIYTSIGNWINENK